MMVMAPNEWWQLPVAFLAGFALRDALPVFRAWVRGF